MNPKEALIKASALCARQEKCIFDIEKKLYDWNVEQSDKEKIINQLLDEKFIDEERYVRTYVKDKFIFNRWGKIKIKYQLKAKSIQGKVVDNELNQIDDSEYKNTLVQLLQQKRRTIKDGDELKIKNSLIRYASSRGFEPELIFQIIDNFV